MPMKLDFANLDLRGAFDMAIMIEEDAQLRYEGLCRLIPDDADGPGAVFRMMARAESRHRSELEARRHVLFHGARRIAISVLDDEGIEAPDVDDDDLPSTAREALEAALEAERRAFRFFDEAIPHLADAEVRRFFLELREEETEHQAILEERIRRLDARAQAAEGG